MKKLLLFVLGVTAFTGYSQNTCATAVTLTPGMTAVGTINGTYVGGCYTGTTPTAAEWYSYTPTSNGVLRVNTNLPTNDGVLQSDDTRFSVFTGVCGLLTCYTGNDDVSEINYLSDLEFLVESGVTYYIQFDNRWKSLAFDVEVTFTAPTCPSTVPYLGGISSALDYACWTSFNANNDAVEWSFNDVNDFDGDGTDDPSIVIFPQTPNAPKDEWLVSKALTMTAGTTYEVTVKYNGANSGIVLANETLEVAMLTTPLPTGPKTTIGTATGIAQLGVFGTPTFTSLAPEVTYTFTPTATADYYLGLHGTSATASGILIIMNVEVESALSVGDNFAETINVFPNPATSVITIANNSSALINSVMIADLNGRVVKSVNLNGVSNPDIQISDLSAGMYMMTIQSDAGSVTKKIIKK